MIFLGLAIIPIGVKLARGRTKTHKYNHWPIQMYKPTNNDGDERNRPGKPVAIAAMMVSLLYIMAGLASIMIGPASYAGRAVMFLFFAAIIVTTLMFPLIMICRLI